MDRIIWKCCLIFEIIRQVIFGIFVFQVISQKLEITISRYTFQALQNSGIIMYGSKKVHNVL